MMKNKNKEYEKCRIWSKPELHKLDLFLTKGGKIAKKNESLSANHYDSTFGGATGRTGQ